MSIKYKKGYKYQLVKPYEYKIGIYPDRSIYTKHYSLHPSGFLRVEAGYSWDGPSGLTLDTKTFMRGSLIHDIIYEMLRNELIDCKYKKLADKELYEICLEDGMNFIRAWWVYVAVDQFGRKSTLPENKKEVIIAP